MPETRKKEIFCSKRGRRGRKSQTHALTTPNLPPCCLSPSRCSQTRCLSFLRGALAYGLKRKFMHPIQMCYFLSILQTSIPCSKKGVKWLKCTDASANTRGSHEVLLISYFQKKYLHIDKRVLNFVFHGHLPLTLSWNCNICVFSDNVLVYVWIDFLHANIDPSRLLTVQRGLVLLKFWWRVTWWPVIQEFWNSTRIKSYLVKWNTLKHTMHSRWCNGNNGKLLYKA